jgi:hypothetical protein
VADNRLARWVGSFDWLMRQCTILVAENGVLGKVPARLAAMWLMWSGSCIVRPHGTWQVLDP